MEVKICQGCLEDDLQDNFIKYRDMDIHNICIEDVKKVEGWE
jgi:hypothetical protein